MSHNTNFFAYVYGQGSNGLYYRAEDSNGNGRVELYGGSGGAHAFVVTSTSNNLPHMVWVSSPYSSYESNYHDSQNFISQNLVYNDHWDSTSQSEITLQTLYDTGDYFGSGSSTSELASSQNIRRMFMLMVCHTAIWAHLMFLYIILT